MTTYFLLITAVVLFSLYKILQILHLAFLTPLAKVPGPWYARFTGLPAIYATVVTQRQVQWNHALFERYGPFVRVSPNDVIVADPAAFKAIHKIGSGFVKSDLYHWLTPTEGNGPPYGVFQETNVAKHAARRKLIARVFSLTALRADWAHAVQSKVTAAVQCIQEAAAANPDGEVDVRKWWVLMASDIITLLMMGTSFDGLKKGEKDPWFDNSNRMLSISTLGNTSPLLYEIAKWVPVPKLRAYYQSFDVVTARSSEAVENSLETSDNKNILAKVLANAKKDEQTLSNAEICTEATGLIFAGSDTTSNTLTFLIWAVLSRPGLQAALEDEVSLLEEPFDDAALEALPIMAAVILETLRLYGAAPFPLPRVVPEGGISFNGLVFPAGTIMSTQAFSLHRDPRYFPDPEKFDHTRWLNVPDAQLSRQYEVFCPFGAGTRVCVGRHLAEMELRYATALFFKRCRGATLAPRTTPKSMDLQNVFIMRPDSGVCFVRLGQHEDMQMLD